MRTDRSSLAVSVRPFRAEDEQPVLDLLRASLGEGPTGQRSSRFFHWKHLENPFGASLMLVAEAEGSIVGLRAFMRWRFKAGDVVLRAVRAVDTGTHPDFQGRGIFSRLTREALDLVRGEADLVFNTPNEKSLPGYLKMGWQVVGRVPISVRVLRPIRFLRGLPSVREGAIGLLGRGDVPPTLAPAVRDILEDEALESLLAERPYQERLSTPLNVEYLRWRYASVPHLDYRVVREPEVGPLRGMAVFHVRPRGRLLETTISDVITRPGDREAIRRLLRRTLAAAATADHATCSFPSGSAAAAAARMRGFLRSPHGITLVANPLREGLRPDPAELRSWALSLGDLEVF
jgi:GNAT superfamily N-acetyltransferase